VNPFGGELKQQECQNVTFVKINDLRKLVPKNKGKNFRQGMNSPGLADFFEGLSVILCTHGRHEKNYIGILH
jgi:hypothetical protein